MNQFGRAREVLFAIEADVFNICVNDSNSLSLLQGISGVPFLEMELYENTKDKKYLTRISTIIDKIFDLLNDIHMDASFSDGYAGLYYMVKNLEKRGAVNKTYLSDLCGLCENLLINYALNSAFDQDFLHGTTGILYSITNTPRQRSRKVHKLVNYLINQLDHHVENLCLESSTSKTLNCGMAHGIISHVMVLCGLFGYERDRKIYDLLKRYARILKTVSDENAAPSQAIFPSIERFDSFGDFPRKYRVPLGWCYGDMSIISCIFKIAKFLEDSILFEFALKLSSQTLGRRTDKEALIYDASFCHGSSSVAHVYNNWFRLYSKPEFGVAYKHWINRTIDLCSFTDGIGGYKKYSGDSFDPEFGILDGASGVGLVLADYIFQKKDSNWESIFLLS